MNVIADGGDKLLHHLRGQDDPRGHLEWPGEGQHEIEDKFVGT